MKKKEDIKKLLNAGRPDSIPAKVLYLLIPFLFIPINLYSQINLNGFGKCAIYNTLPGYSNLIQLNFNQDDYSDVMLFDPSQKRFVLHKGQKENTFSKPIDKFFFYSISNIKFLQTRKNEADLYLFTSRRDRNAGLVSFTKYGTLQLLNLREFDSYPSNISVADINLDGSNEALISGPAFDGLSILSLNKLSLKEQKIIAKRSFTNSEFIDINLDGYPDIAAIDLIDNSVKIFINNREGSFIENSSINFIEKIGALKVLDINSDDYLDISVVKENGLEIMLGDSVSTFEKRIKYELSFTPSEYELTDLNSDGNTDIILLNQKKNRIEIYFMNGKQTLPQPFIFSNDNKLSSFKLLRKGNAKRLAVVFSSGRLNILGKITSSQHNFSFISGLSSKLYAESNKTNFLIYRNITDKPFLNILTGNSGQRFQSITSIPLLINYDNLAVENKGFGNFNFYLFASKSMEIVSFSEFDFSIEYRNFIPHAPPIDIRIVEDQQIESKFLHLLFNDNGNLGIENVEIDEKNIISQGIDNIDSNVVGAVISNSEMEEIHYWKYRDSLLTFNSLRQMEELKFKFDSEDINIGADAEPEISFTFIGSDNRNLISQVIYNQNTFYYLFDGSKLSRLTVKNTDKNLNFLMPKMLATVNTGKHNQYVLYDKNSGYFKKVIFNLRTKNIEMTNYIESNEVNGYFVTSYFGNELYLFYSGSNNNLITITKIE